MGQVLPVVPWRDQLSNPQASQVRHREQSHREHRLREATFPRVHNELLMGGLVILCPKTITGLLHLIPQEPINTHCPLGNWEKWAQGMSPATLYVQSTQRGLPRSLPTGNLREPGRGGGECWVDIATQPRISVETMFSQSKHSCTHRLTPLKKKRKKYKAYK